MSVIGRLDEQVEAVLINPLKQRRAPVGEMSEQPPTTTTPAPAAEERSDTETTDERREGEASLPVWLL